MTGAVVAVNISKLFLRVTQWKTLTNVSVFQSQNVRLYSRGTHFKVNLDFSQLKQLLTLGI